MAKGNASNDSSPDGNSFSGTPSTGAASSNRSTRSKPYDANNSFVKKLSTKVSWIGKIGWFNNSQDERDLQNEDTEDLDVMNDSRSTQPPPSKRPCIRMDVTHPPGTFDIKPRNKNAAVEMESANHNETTQDFLEPLASGSNFKPRFVASTPAFSGNSNNKGSYTRSALNMLMSQQNNIATNGTDDNSESGESTSGCSSLVPQNPRQDGQNTNYNSPFPNQRRFTDDKMSFTNHLQSPRSLFLDSAARETLSSRQPSFNPLIVTQNNSIDKSSSMLSPFYPGKTMFGGANAANMFKKGKSLLANTSQVLNRTAPNRASVEVNPSSNNASTTDVSNMSVTARRILETLEQFSSPLSDAKKIPIRNVMGASTSSNTSLSSTLAGNRKRAREDECDTPKVGLRHLARELTVPTVPDIMRIRRKQRMQNITLNARKIMSARNAASAPLMQEYALRSDADNESKRSNAQLKAKKKTNLEEEDSVIPVNLPTMPLPIKNLPRFDLALPAQTTFSSTSSTPPQSKLLNANESFKFASPIRLEGERNLESINDFTFSKPITPSKMISNLSVSESSEVPKTSINSMGSTETDSRAATFQNFMWSGNSNNSPLKPKHEESKVSKGSPDYKNGSVMDFFRKEAEKKNQNVWECNECLIKNNEKVTHCVACKRPKPDEDDNSSDIEIIECPSSPEPKSSKTEKENSIMKSSSQLPNSSASIFGKISNTSTKISTQDSTSTCSNTLNILTQSSSTKSIPTITFSSSNHETTQMNSFASNESVSSMKTKSSKSSWECPCCMVHNLDSLNLCPCCNTAKPGSINVSPKRSTESSAPLTTTTTFGTGFGDKFKKPEGTWTCDTCMIQNKTEVSKCAACETPKPGSVPTSVSTIALTSSSGFGDKFKKPEGSWSCDSCMLSNKASDSKCVACENPKPGSENVDSTKPKLQFNVDMPANTSGFQFGIDKAGETSKNISDLPKTNGFSFGASSTTTNANFSFGVPADNSKTNTGGFSFKPNESTTAATFQFGAKSVESDKKDDENKSAGFSFGAQTKKSESTSGFVFGSPKKVEEKKENTPAAATFVFGSQTASTTIVDNSSSSKEIKSSEIQSSGFSFGSSKPTFEIPGTCATTKTESETKSTENTKISSFEPPKSNILPFGASVTSTASTTTANISNTTTPSLFSFGAHTTGAAITAASTISTEKKTSTVPFGSNIASPSFSNQANQPTQSLFGTPSSTSGSVDVNKPLFGNQSSDKKLGATPSTFGGTENKISSFSANTDNKLNSNATFPSSTFGTPTTTASLTTSPFGSLTNANTIQAPTSFGTPLAVSTNASALTFGSSVTTTSNSAPSPFGSGSNMFGSGSSSSFGANATPSIFGTTAKPAEAPAPTSGLFSFNQPSQPTAPASGFNFPGASAAPGSTEQKGIFSFGASSNVQPGNGFGGSFNSGVSTATSSFSFNTPSKPEATSSFGQPAVSGSTPMFNAPNSQPLGAPPAYPGTAAPVTPASGGFNFGSTNVPNTFNFGSQSTTPASSSGFNFSAPTANTAAAPVTFDPNATPTFNFTAGTGAPNAFNAPPSASGMPVRKIKKAVRRMRQ